MKSILIIALLMLSAFTFAQTDIIEIRSRGASLKSYERVSKIVGADHVASNFGKAPTMLVQSAVLDSVKSISDSTTVMYTSNYCWRAPKTRKLVMEERNRQNGQAPEKRYASEGIGKFWQPGADTIVNHPLFQHVHSLDSVKNVIDQQYYFRLPSDSIEFIGFDNINQATVEPQRESKRENKNKENGIGWELLMLLAAPISILWIFSKYLFPRTTN